MAKIRKLYDDAIKPDGSKQTIYPITSTRAVYTPTNVTIDSILNEGYRFGGVVTPNDSPDITDQRVFYAASIPGIYAAFGNIAVDGGEAIFLMFNGTSWVKGIFGGAGSSNLSGFKSLESINDLPLEKSDLGYLIKDPTIPEGITNEFLYVWVGENGDTLGGLYQKSGQLRGASAYEIAVRNGYEGTEEEWLNDPVNGIKGVSVQSFELIGSYSPADSATNTYKVTLSNGEILNIPVKNGKGISSMQQTVVSQDDGGTNVVIVTLSDGTTTTFQFKNGEQGNTGASIDYPYELINNLNTDDATKGLSAAMGKQLSDAIIANNEMITVVEGKINGFSPANYTIERGGISSTDGTDSASTTRLRTSGYVTGGTLHIIPGSGKAMIFAYNEAGYIKNIDWTTSPIDVSIVGATKYRVVFAKTNDIAITISDFSTLGMNILVKTGVTANHLTEDTNVSGIRVLNPLHGNNYCNSSEITAKSGAYISRTTGEYKSSGSSGTAGVTGFIPISGMALCCNYGYGSNSASWAAYRKATDAELTDSSVTKFVVGDDVVVFSHSGGQTAAKQYTYTSGDIYVRFTLSSVTDVMVNEGAVPQSYVPYSIAATFNGDLFGKTIDIDNIKQTEFSYNSANLCNPAECFFSDHNYIDGTTGRITTSSTTPSLGITGMIPIDEDGLYFEQSLVSGSMVGYAYFDEHGNYLDGYCTQHLIPGGTSKFAKYINGAKWVVFTIAEGSTNLMINKGNIAHPYEEYAGKKEVISKEILPDFTEDIAEKKTMLDGVDIVLPSEIIITQGDRLQIFYRDIITAYNSYDFDVMCTCVVGKPRPRCFEYTPNAAAVGNTYPLTVKIYDNNHRVVASASTNIKVIAKATSPVNQKNILLIGASTLYDGTIAKEVNRRFTNVTGDGTYYNPTGLGLSNIALVGRTTTSDASVNQESQSGWQWKDYATSGRTAYRFFISDIGSYDIREGAVYSGNGTLKFTVTEINNTDGYISCTYDGSGTQPASGTLTKYSGDGSDSITYSSYNIDSRNPFWDDNSNALNFTSYINDYCGGHLDVFVSYLGINDVFQSRTPQETIENYVIPFLRALHTQSSATKVIICNLHIPSPNGGVGNTYDATARTYWTLCKKYFDYIRALNELVEDDEFSSWVSIASTFEEFDAENLYPTNSTRTICNRSEVTETIQSDGVHPTTNGKKAIADSIYHKITQLL